MLRSTIGCTCTLLRCPSIFASSSRSFSATSVAAGGGPRPRTPRTPASRPVRKDDAGGRGPLEKKAKFRSDASRAFDEGKDGRPVVSKPAFGSAWNEPKEPESTFGRSTKKLARDLLPTPSFSRKPSPPPALSSAEEHLSPAHKRPSIYPSPFTAPSYPSPSSGSLLPLPKHPFPSYSLAQPLKDGLLTYFNGKLPTPTPIQALSLQYLVGSALQPLNKKPGQEERKEILLGSETGSGKTLAYLLPLLHFLKQTDSPSPTPASGSQTIHPRSLILSPTHELTRQLTLTAKSFSHSIKLRVGGLSSTASGNVRGGAVDVLVGTTRGVKRGVERGEIGLEGLEWVVVDEADVLFGDSFEEETKSIINSISEKTLTPPSLILCTATIPPALSSYVKSTHPNMLKLLSPSLHKLPSKLTPRFVPWSGSGNKLADVAHEIKRVFSDDAAERRLAGQEGEEGKGKILVFCNGAGKVRMLQKVLEGRSIPSVAITGEAEDRVRGSNGALDDFLVRPGSQNAPSSAPDTPTSTAKTPRVLITTSLLSRGLDFSPTLRHVFLLDEPRSILDFMHRAGRTGRAGQVGTVTVFGNGSRDREGRELRVGEGMRRWGGGTRLGKELKEVLGRGRVHGGRKVLERGEKKVPMVAAAV